jgi:DNA-directed RNA polymerase beta' subunit
MQKSLTYQQNLYFHSVYKDKTFYGYWGRGYFRNADLPQYQTKGYQCKAQSVGSTTLVMQSSLCIGYALQVLSSQNLVSSTKKQKNYSIWNGRCSFFTEHLSVGQSTLTNSFICKAHSQRTLTYAPKIGGGTFGTLTCSQSVFLFKQEKKLEKKVFLLNVMNSLKSEGTFLLGTLTNRKKRPTKKQSFLPFLSQRSLEVGVCRPPHCKLLATLKAIQGPTTLGLCKAKARESYKKSTNQSQISKESIFPKNVSKKFDTAYSKLSEIQLVTIGLASPEKIRQWAEKTLPNGKVIGQVLNANTLHHKSLKPQKGGLFCERIFGPLKDFECACGKVQKPTKQERLANQLKESNSISNINMIGDSLFSRSRKYCPVCDVEYTWSVIRRYQLGYIQLVSPVTHIWFLKGNPSYLSILFDMKKRHLEYVTYCTESLTIENVMKGNVGRLTKNPGEILFAWKQLILKSSGKPELFTNYMGDFGKSQRSLTFGQETTNNQNEGQQKLTNTNNNSLTNGNSFFQEQPNLEKPNSTNRTKASNILRAQRALVMQSPALHKKEQEKKEKRKKTKPKKNQSWFLCILGLSDNNLDLTSSFSFPEMNMGHKRTFSQKSEGTLGTLEPCKLLAPLKAIQGPSTSTKEKVQILSSLIHQNIYESLSMDIQTTLNKDFFSMESIKSVFQKYPRPEFENTTSMVVNSTKSKDYYEMINQKLSGVFQTNTRLMLSSKYQLSSLNRVSLQKILKKVPTSIYLFFNLQLVFQKQIYNLVSKKVWKELYKASVKKSSKEVFSIYSSVSLNSTLLYSKCYIAEPSKHLANHKAIPGFQQTLANTLLMQNAALHKSSLLIEQSASANAELLATIKEKKSLQRNTKKAEVFSSQRRLLESGGTLGTLTKKMQKMQRSANTDLLQALLLGPQFKKDQSKASITLQVLDSSKLIHKTKQIFLYIEIVKRKWFDYFLNRMKTIKSTEGLVLTKKVILSGGNLTNEEAIDFIANKVINKNFPVFDLSVGFDRPTAFKKRKQFKYIEKNPNLLVPYEFMKILSRFFLIILLKKQICTETINKEPKQLLQKKTQTNKETLKKAIIRLSNLRKEFSAFSMKRREKAKERGSLLGVMTFHSGESHRSKSTPAPMKQKKKAEVFSFQRRLQGEYITNQLKHEITRKQQKAEVFSSQRRLLGRSNPLLDSVKTKQQKEQKPFLVNNFYSISHRERWIDAEWQNFIDYMTVPDVEGGLSLNNSFQSYVDDWSNKQKNTGERGYFWNADLRNYETNGKAEVFSSQRQLEQTEKNLFTASFPNQIIPLYQDRISQFNMEPIYPGKRFSNKNQTNYASFSGPGILQQLLKEFDFSEQRKMDKQNRILLYQLNKHIYTLRKQIQKKSAKKELKESYKYRDQLIRRTKLIRTFFRKDSNPNSMILTLLPVLPPDLRPIVKIGGQIAASDLNRLYQRVIYRNDRLQKFLKDPATSSSYEMKYAQRLLQEAVDNLIQNGKSGVASEKDARGRALKSLSDLLKGKQGRFRQYLLGKRVDYSGRSVIVVGPKLKLHECGLPKEMAFELYLPFLLKKILNHNYARTVVGAKTFIQKNPSVTWELLKEIMQTCPVLLNRAPTLHRLGIQAFQPKLIDGRAILLHPLVCPAFNADFDGDQMAVHVPITVEARAEAWKLMGARNNFLAPSTGEPLAIPSQDMVLGCYYLTTNCNKPTIQLQRGTGLAFSNFSDVLNAYHRQIIDLHSLVWVKFDDLLEQGNDQDEPIEIRINSYGNWKEIYQYNQKNYTYKNHLVNEYICTTPGRILFNFYIRSI